MPLSVTTRNDIRDTMGVLRVVAGLVLLVALSWEIIAGDHIHFSRTYLSIQLVVCIFFLIDIGLRRLETGPGTHFFLRNGIYLLISIPWLNIIVWCDWQLSHDWSMLIGLMPLLRAFLAMIIVVRWLVSGKFRQLFAAYIFTVVVFTYISALVFYDYEVLVNPKLHGFGNALWWAWMNVTTVGAEIFPVTTIGKIVCILLPSLGMMFFPIFTTYVLQQFAIPSQKKSGE